LGSTGQLSQVAPLDADILNYRDRWRRAL